MTNVEILIVEDEGIVAKDIRYMLEDMGYAVLAVVSSGEEAIEKTVEKCPDLVLMDIVLKGAMDGVEAAEQIRHRFDIPVVYLTAYSDDKTLQRAKITEPFGYILKPFEERELRSIIEIALHKHQLERKIREREEYFRALIENSTDVIMVLDSNGNIRYVSPSIERVLGYKPEELIDKNAFEFIHSNDTQMNADAFTKTIQNRVAVRLEEFSFRHKDSSWRIFEANIQNRLDDPAVGGIVVNSRDITERKCTEEEEKHRQQQLIQADKMASLGILVSGVAHEINNPNHLIMTNTSTLLDIWESIYPIIEKYYKDYGDFDIGSMPFSNMKKSIPDLFSGILDGTNRIKYIVKELRDFARESPGELNDAIDINEVVKSVTVLVSNMVKKSTNKFSTELSENLPEIKGNYRRLEQVVINLIQNACQALSDNNQSIIVSTSYDSKANSIVLIVKDEGTGIPKDEIIHITDPFFTTKRDSGGTGLGLSISSTIINDHGGILTFSSSPGKGTTATVTLPVKG